MNALAHLGAAVKAAGPKNKLTFANTANAGGYLGTAMTMPYLGTNLLQQAPFAASGGDAINFDREVGDPLSNSVVAACVNAIAQALPDAPVYLEQRVKDGWERVDDHPVLDLLRTPNKDHSESELWGFKVGQERTRGQAFWYIAYNAGQPAELWPVQTERVTVIGTPDEYIAGYKLLSDGGKTVEVEDTEIIHFRHALSPLNQRLGWTPLSTGSRQIFGDNWAASYHAAILRNSGVMSLLISVKEGAAAGSVTPEQISSFTEALKRKLFGAGAGAIAGMNLPLEVHKMSYSPDEMALEKLINYYETRIAALLGVAPMVIGLASGDGAKTYSNLSEAINDFWERCIVPMRSRDAAALRAQLLPLFGMDPNEWRVCFDYSNVAALQENADQLFTRWVNVFAKQGCDLFTLQTKLGIQDVPEEYKERFSGPQSPTTDMDNTNQPDATKAAPGDGPKWTEAELDAMCDDLSVDDVKAALATSTPEMRALLQAKQEGE